MNCKDFEKLPSDPEICHLLAGLESLRAQFLSVQVESVAEDTQGRLADVLEKPFQDFELADFCKAHTMVFQESEAGEIRTLPALFSHNPELIIRFELPARIRPRLNELMDCVRDGQKRRVPLPLIAALFFAEFCDIHPFSNGNGRTARLLAGVFLAQQDYPPFVVPEQTMPEYLTGLADYSIERTVGPFSKFFIRRLSATLVELTN